MKISFENYKSIKSIKSGTLIMFVSEEYIENLVKEKGTCECGNNCKCGDRCDCKKTPVQQSVYEFDFKGKPSEIAMVGSKESNFDRVMLVGFGKESELTNVKAEEIGYKAIKYLKANKIKYVSCIFNTKITDDGSFEFSENLRNGDFVSMYAHLVFGFSMGEYSFNKYLTGDKLKAKTVALKEVEFITKYPEELEQKFNEYEVVKNNVFFCRDLINEPANVIYPESFVKIAKELDKLGVDVEVLKVKDMEKLGMGSLLAVGQGSDKEPYMVILKWNGAKSDDKPVAFIGKGITFDSGGLSLKPSSAMDTMKCDMSGSAVVLSLIRLLAMRKAKVNAVGVMALAENMPSGKAVKVGDIVKSMSGQTIEVLNTDAEGRMVLADALYYTATKFSPKIMVDLATLTGAICVALGEKYAGMFTNTADFSKELEVAGTETGENVWRMPLSKLGGFYDKQIDSDVADVRNTGKTRDGGAITAAQFLQRFTNKHPKWAHLDIAATAYVNQDGFMTQKYATGYGVRLLNELIKNNYED